MIKAIVSMFDNLILLTALLICRSVIKDFSDYISQFLFGVKDYEET